MFEKRLREERILINVEVGAFWFKKGNLVVVGAGAVWS
jgi:hypothetical protein